MCNVTSSCDIVDWQQKQAFCRNRTETKVTSGAHLTHDVEVNGGGTEA